MSARLLVHPRVARDPALSSALAADLYRLGYDTYQQIVIYNHSTQARRSKVDELVRDRGPADGGVLYERFDGVQFVHPYAVPRSPVAA